jgi:ADP-ribose pyrophosphatase YjhB (NUDIX family)
LKIYQRLPRRLRRWVVRRLTPSFTVGAACIVERDDGAVLLVRQVYRRGWGMPGGLSRRREEMEDTARREVLEEVGLPIELVGRPAVVVDPVPRRVDVVFRARPADGSDASTARPSSPEIAEVRWWPAGQLPELQHETVTALEALGMDVPNGVTS